MLESTSVERWLPVVGHELSYQVSNLGRVWSNQAGRPLTPKLSSYGHLRVGLSRDGWSRWTYVHVLVLEAFVGPRPAGLVSCHGKGGRLDNRPENLRWDTLAANARDRVEDGNHFNANKPQCPQGHDYDPENTYVTPAGVRQCRICRRDRQVSEKGRAAKRIRDARRRARQRLEL